MILEPKQRSKKETSKISEMRTEIYASRDESQSLWPAWYAKL